MNNRIQIRLRLSHRPAAALLVTLCFLGVLAWRQASERAAGMDDQTLVLNQADLLPSFYITDLSYYADEALGACAPGYHFASLWEISDPSSLQYNTTLGQTTLDSGGGPPTIMGLGWVRTGYNFSDVSTTVGHANCNLWSSRSNLDNGSVAVLPQIWTSGAQDLSVWDLSTRTCNFKLGVWCKQNPTQSLFLPLIPNP